MLKQKTIPELKAEIAANERQLAQLRHKQQQFENRAAYYEKNQPRVKRGVFLIQKDHIQKIFGCGLYTINNSTNMSTYSNGSNFFSHNSSSKVLLVEAGGVEPPSENSLTGTSPGAGRYLLSLTQAGTNTLLRLVASLMHGTGKAYRTHVLH